MPRITSGAFYVETWYLMYSSFPDLNWARLRVFSDGGAEVFDCDGNVYKFQAREEAVDGLLEDEFTAFDSLGADDEVDYGITITEISHPYSESDAGLVGLMYVKANKA
jgi:hypothetical protein